jgi:hypothetical protein
MKTEIFSRAIRNRNQIRFIYGFNEVILDPYYISREGSGKKVIYGRTRSSNEIKKFEYDRIVNIKVLQNIRFTPIIPIIARAV